MVNRKLLFVTLLLVLVMAFTVLSGCSSSATSTTTSTTPPASTTAKTSTPATSTTTPTATTVTPQKGGALRILTSQAWQANWGWPGTASPSFNPYLPSPVAECLLKVDKQGHPVAFLVDTWNYTPDNKSLILHLHKGIKFHDGTDFNATTVQFGLRALLASKQPELTGVTDPAQIVVVDDYTVQLNLNVFSTQVVDDLAQLAGSAGAMSQAAFEKGGAQSLLLHPVATGPFVFDSVVQNASMKFTKFDNYWMPGKPYLDSVEWNFFADPVTAKTAFQGGDGQVIVNLNAADAAELAKTGKYNMVSAVQRVCAIAGSADKPNSPFAKLGVRQAVSYAIDTKSIAAALGYGYWNSTNQLVDSSSDMYNPDIVGYPFNPQKAKQLLTDNGYPSGFDTNLYFPTNSGYEDWMAAVQKNLSDVGIRAKLNPIDLTTYNSTIRGKGWDGLAQWQNYISVGYQPSKMMAVYLSQRAIRYPSIVHPDDIEALLNDALSSPDKAKIIADYKQMNKLSIDTYCQLTPLFIFTNLGAEYKTVHDINMFDPWQEKWTPQDTWLSK